MRNEHQWFLREHKLPLYVFTIQDLTLLQEIVTEELEMRNSIDSKVKALALAEKVEKASGNDQHLEDLKQDLFLARQTYAKRITVFDDNRYTPGYVAYDNSTGLPYMPEEENRLQPIVQPHSQEPIWEVSEVQDDGTLKHIGFSGGQS